MKDSAGLYPVERRERYAQREGFRITELQISTAQTVPWHHHRYVSDTFYVLQGKLRLFVRAPQEQIDLLPGQSYCVEAMRPHLVTNAGDESAVFLVLQGVGEYDYIAED
jgi:quercetin dioxygenase-like cupin family protein